MRLLALLFVLLAAPTAASAVAQDYTPANAGVAAANEHPMPTVGEGVIARATSRSTDVGAAAVNHHRHHRWLAALLAPPLSLLALFLVTRASRRVVAGVGLRHVAGGPVTPRAPPARQLHFA